MMWPAVLRIGINDMVSLAAWTVENKLPRDIFDRQNYRKQ